MATTDNIFGGGDPTPSVPPTPEGQTGTVPTAPQVDPFTPFLETIKGDDGQPKYKDVPTALTALQHSQEYIKQLKQQLDDATQKASQAVTMEQVLETLKKQGDHKPDATPAPVLTADDVIRLLNEKEAKEKARANTSVVSNKFKEVYGEKAEEIFYTRAGEMGLSREAVNQLASSSPTAVFSMFGIKDGAAPAPATPNGINTVPMQTPSPSPLGTVMGFKKDTELAEYWSKLKAEVNANLGIK